MSGDKIELTPEMGKDELVWAMAILLSCQDMPEQINKLSKPCLFRLFDQFSVIGSSNNELNNDIRKLENTIMVKDGEIAALRGKLDRATKPYRNKGRNSNV